MARLSSVFGRGATDPVSRALGGSRQQVMQPQKRGKGPSASFIVPGIISGDDNAPTPIVVDSGQDTIDTIQSGGDAGDIFESIIDPLDTGFPEEARQIGEVITGEEQRDAIEEAAQRQEEAAQRAITVTEEAIAQTREDLSPFREFGEGQIPTLEGRLDSSRLADDPTLQRLLPLLEERATADPRTISGDPGVSSLLSSLQERAQRPSTALTSEGITQDPLFQELFGEAVRAGTAASAAGGKGIGSGDFFKDLTSASIGIGSKLIADRRQAEQAEFDRLFSALGATTGVAASDIALEQDALQNLFGLTDTATGLASADIGLENIDRNLLFDIIGRGQSAAAGQGAATQQGAQAIAGLFGDIGDIEAANLIGQSASRQAGAGNVASILGTIFGVR